MREPEHGSEPPPPPAKHSSPVPTPAAGRARQTLESSGGLGFQSASTGGGRGGRRKRREGRRCEVHPGKLSRRQVCPEQDGPSLGPRGHLPAGRGADGPTRGFSHLLSEAFRGGRRTPSRAEMETHRNLGIFVLFLPLTTEVAQLAISGRGSTNTDSGYRFQENARRPLGCGWQSSKVPGAVLLLSQLPRTPGPASLPGCRLGPALLWPWTAGPVCACPLSPRHAWCRLHLPGRLRRVGLAGWQAESGWAVAQALDCGESSFVS